MISFCQWGKMFLYKSPIVRSLKETLIKSLSDFILGFLYRARNHLTRIASYVRKMMTKLCIKILVKSDSAIESAFPWQLSHIANLLPSYSLLVPPHTFFQRNFPFSVRESPLRHCFLASLTMARMSAFSLSVSGFPEKRAVTRRSSMRAKEAKRGSLVRADFLSS